MIYEPMVWCACEKDACERNNHRNNEIIIKSLMMCTVSLFAIWKFWVQLIFGEKKGVGGGLGAWGG